MKQFTVIYAILTVLPLAMTAIVLPMLSDVIPVHYNALGDADRWGSKYEVLFMPIFTIGMGIFMYAMANAAAKQASDGRKNRKIVLMIGCVSAVFFNIMNAYLLHLAFTKTENLNIDLSGMFDKIAYISVGIIFVIVGCVLPKVKKNDFIGVRTKWSMQNDQTWEKSQKFGSFSFVIGGVLLILLSCFFEWLTVFILCMLIISALVIANVYYSYRVANHQKNGDSV